MNCFNNVIINFHEIHDQEWFEMVLNVLNRLYDFVPISEIEEYYYNNKNLSGVCHITFDDGDKSFYTTAFPVLVKYNIPASIYVSPHITVSQNNFWFQEIAGYDNKLVFEIAEKVANIPKDKLRKYSLNGVLKSLEIDTIQEIIKGCKEEIGVNSITSQNMDLDQLKELRDSNLVTIGAHTNNHPILKNEKDHQSFNEIQKSIEDLKELLGQEINYFAYPNGISGLDYGKREMDYLTDCGIKLGLSSDVGHFSKNDNPLTIPRLSLNYGGKSFVVLKVLIGKHWEKLRKALKGSLQEGERREILDLLDKT